MIAHFVPTPAAGIFAGACVFLAIVSDAVCQDYKLNALVLGEGNSTHFTYRAELTPNETKSLQVTVHGANENGVTDLADKVEDSLTSTIPATITRALSADKKQIDLTISATNSAAGDVTNHLSYQVEEAASPKPWVLKYDLLERTNKLNASLSVRLRKSQSNGDESSVAVTVRSAKAALTIPNVDLSGRFGKHINVTALRGYDVLASRHITVNLSETDVDHTDRLENAGARDLPPARVSVFDAGGNFIASDELADDLLRGKLAYLTISDAAEPLVGVTWKDEKTGQLHEARRIAASGHLTYLAWTTRKAIFENKSATNQTVRVLISPTVDVTNHQDVTLGARTKSEQIIGVKRDRDDELDLAVIEAEFDLLNVYPRSSPDHPSSLALLKQVRRYSATGAAKQQKLKETIKRVRDYHATILHTLKTTTELEASKQAAADARDALLRLPDPPQSEVERLRRRVNEIQEAIERNKAAERDQRVALIKFLIP